jgi:hypothetical protein
MADRQRYDCEDDEDQYELALVLRRVRPRHHHDTQPQQLLWTITLHQENGLGATIKGTQIMQDLHDDKVISFRLGDPVDKRGRKATISSPPTWGAASSGTAIFTPDADGLGGTFDGNAGTDNGACEVDVTATDDKGNTFTNKIGVNVISDSAVGFTSPVFGAETDPTVVTPPGPTPLDASYADASAFSAAAAAYAGPEEVDLDGAVIKSGTAPALEYFSHSDQGGVINTTGPTS